MDFQTALYHALNNLPGWDKPFQAKLGNLLTKLIQTPQDQAILISLEHYVKARLGLAPTDVVDWARGNVGVNSLTKAGTATIIDWTTILAFIEQFLPILLSILGIFIPMPTPTPTPVPVP